MSVNPELHFSQLKHIDKSAQHYLYALKNPPEQTAVMRFGTAVHTAVLGGGAIAVWEGDRRGNAWKCFEEDHRDQLILTTKEHKLIMGAAHAVMSNDDAMRALEGKREVKLTWDYAGRKCGGRIDVVGSECVTELKATTCAEPNWFQRHGRTLGYPAQVRWYMHAVKKAKGNIVAVEMKPPHLVTVLPLTEECLLQAQRQLTTWLEKLRLCEESNVWPGYSQCPVPYQAADDVDLIFDEEAA